MLTYLLSGAVALVVGASGGFLGGRLANANLRRGQHAMFEHLDGKVAEIQKLLGDRPTTQELGLFFQNQQQAMAQAFVTREQLEPVLREVITRPELDQALQAVVIGISRNAGLPLPATALTNDAVALAGASGDQLATTIARLSQQMGQVNQQLGLG